MKTVQINNPQKLNLISNLGTMLSSGIPILESVDSLISENSGGTRRILERLHDDLNQGKTMSESFEKSSKSFDAVTINLIKAAEEAGTLDTTLKDLTVSIKADMEFSDKLKGALTYPALVVVVLVMVLILNLFFVIPRISSVFSRLHIVLPLPTRILLWISNLLVSHTIEVILGGVLFVGLIVFVYKKQKGMLMSVISTLPLVSDLAREIDVTRFCRSMALLLSSGIPLVDALDLSANVVGRKELRKVIKSSVEVVSSGKTMSSSFKKHANLIPGFMVRIIAAGEKSGTLEKSMQELSDQFDERVSVKLRQLTILIEPALLLIVGLLVGALMLAIIAPIYNLIGKINPR